MHQWLERWEKKPEALGRSELLVDGSIKEVCRKANIETGDCVELVLAIASEDLPAELAMLIKQNPIARQRWDKLTPAQQRMLREDVLSAKQSATRARRAARELGVD